jgi:hypothetical protein
MRDINKDFTFWLTGANLLTSVSHPPLGGLHLRILQNHQFEIEMLFVFFEFETSSVRLLLSN